MNVWEQGTLATGSMRWRSQKATARIELRAWERCGNHENDATSLCHQLRTVSPQRSSTTSGSYAKS